MLRFDRKIIEQEKDRIKEKNRAESKGEQSGLLQKMGFARLDFPIEGDKGKRRGGNQKVGQATLFTS